MTTPIVIARLLPELLSINGSSANAEILAATLDRMGHPVRRVDVTSQTDAAVTPDIVCVGSGSTSALQPALTALVPLTAALRGWVEGGAAFFAVGMGWDLLGRDMTVADSRVLPGIGLYPSSSDYRTGRFAGEVGGTDYRGREIAGYINQVGTSTLHDGEPLMTITHCKNPIDSREGIVRGKLFGTKLGGPALSVNPDVRDDVLDTVLATRGLGQVADCSTPDFIDFHARVDEVATKAREKILSRLR
jgi:CobQ-like glutamine amidotransferase family enzyme